MIIQERNGRVRRLYTPQRRPIVLRYRQVRMLFRHLLCRLPSGRI